MGKINYKSIYDDNKHGWYAMTEDPQKYEALLAGHYSDSNHFVYELLQNAEDERAGKVVIEYYSDKLVFYHNGDPFDEADVRGVSSMLMGTKDRDDAQTIGRFGMGFKSVFKYTYQPEIYSDDEAFKITRYLLPVENTDNWNYEAEKKSIICKLGGGRSFMPFSNEKHLTKIIIPFLKYGKNGDLVSVPGDDVLKKLDELDGEILLFLSHIQNLYWINKETGKFAYITLDKDEKDSQMVTCRIEGTEYGEKEEITRYLKFTDKFDHPDMKGAEVSVAYKLNSRSDNINEVDESSVWVYFPTRDETDLPFLIHGSFETAVSREKLMTPSDFNNDLFDHLGDLIADSMDDLAERKLITQAFIRRVIMAAFDDEENNETIPGLKEKVTEKFLNSEILPCRTGEYMNPSDMVLPVPFRMGDYRDKSLFAPSFDGVKRFVAFNNEREKNFTEYYRWLTDDLKIKVFPLSEWAQRLEVLKGKKVPSAGEFMDQLKEFYDFCSDNRESVYSTGLSYTRSGPYELAIRNDIKKAWENLRHAPVILNRLNLLVAAYDEKKPLIYLAASSEYKSVMQSAIVHVSIATSFSKVLSEGFEVHEFNNFQYIREKVIQKYIDVGDRLGFADHDNFTDEYIEDLKQIFALIDQTGKLADIREMLKDAYIVKVKPKTGDKTAMFERPRFCYAPISDEGINLNIYFAPIPSDYYDDDDVEEEDRWYDFEYSAIDEDFYSDNGISISTLSKIGLITTPVDEGIRHQDGVGDNHWIAQGEYCPQISIEDMDTNIEYIEEYPDEELAKRKSAEILKLALIISRKLQGKKKFRKNNPYIGELEECNALWLTIKRSSWLYDKDMNLNKPGEITKFDLNPGLYGSVSSDDKAYEILGFVEKEVDSAEEALQKAQNLDRSDQMRLLNWLAKSLGKEVSDPGKDDGDDWGDDDDPSAFFNPNEWQDNDFPVNRVGNIEYLIKHVQEQFYCADPVTYQKVWRQIRVSKNSEADRSYAIGMYTNAGNTKICQMCKKPVAFIEVAQIANYGIEMPQLNLCLCRECSAKYSAMRDGNKDEFKKGVRAMIMALDTTSVADDYAIEFNSDMVLHFTQTHAAEIQEIFRLLAEYGTPSKDVDEVQDTATGPLMHPVRQADISRRIASDRSNSFSNVSIEPTIVAEADAKEEKREKVVVDDPDVAREGCFITYKKKFGDFEIYDNVLQPKKIPLHAELEGHRVGDIITFQGKKYEITVIM